MEVSLSLRVVASVGCGHSIVFVVVVDAVFNITKSLPLNPPLLFPLLVGLCTRIVFFGPSAFNSDISKWNTGAVTTMNQSKSCIAWCFCCVWLLFRVVVVVDTRF